MNSVRLLMVCMAVMFLVSSCAHETVYDREKEEREQAFAEAKAQANFTADVCEALLGNVPVVLEIADDEAERQQGLMFRASMPEDHGMLFIFPDEQVRTFWMKDTYIDLDIAFLDANGCIVDIQRMNKLSFSITASRAPAQYAIEMNAGWFARRSVEKGTLLDLQAIKKKLYVETTGGYEKA